MKNIVIVMLLFIYGPVLAQTIPDDGFDRIRIVQPDKTIQAEIKPVGTGPIVKADRFYYWYSANTVHSTQGGFSGDLLNGLYNEFYLNKNLKTQGVFRKGLKDGNWKSWNEDGTLINTTHWANGIIVVPKNKISFLKRVNVFKKKDKSLTDTMSKTNH